MEPATEPTTPPGSPGEPGEAVTPDADPHGVATLSDALGGPLGVLESTLPSAAYVAAYTISGQDTTVSLVAALVLGGVLAVVRLARGQTLRFALSGLVGVALAAFVVARTGRAEDFFLPGLLLNAAYAAGYAISILVRRPLIGVLVGALTGEGMAWRQDPDRLRAYSRATWVWVGLFVTRLAVQLPLYLAGAVVVLGAAKVAMGLPLFALGIWLSWLVLRPSSSTA